MMWQHKELHDLFRRAGLKESDFYSGTLARGKSGKTGDSATLGRPISSQGAERPARLRSENLDESADSARYVEFAGNNQLVMFYFPERTVKVAFCSA